LPTYQYTCTDCGEPVEALQKFSDPPLTVCAACGGKLRKVFSPVGIVFKGSGFYRNDSRKGPDTATDTKKDSKSSESSTVSSNGSSDPSSTSATKESKPKDTAAAPVKSSSSEKVA
jgi:putative FmdB family regulatory protein